MFCFPSKREFNRIWADFHALAQISEQEHGARVGWLEADQIDRTSCANQNTAEMLREGERENVNERKRERYI